MASVRGFCEVNLNNLRRPWLSHFGESKQRWHHTGIIYGCSWQLKFHTKLMYTNAHKSNKTLLWYFHSAFWRFKMAALIHIHYCISKVWPGYYSEGKSGLEQHSFTFGWTLFLNNNISIDKDMWWLMRHAVSIDKPSPSSITRLILLLLDWHHDVKQCVQVCVCLCDCRRLAFDQSLLSRH